MPYTNHFQPQHPRDTAGTQGGTQTHPSCWAWLRRESHVRSREGSFWENSGQNGSNPRQAESRAPPLRLHQVAHSGRDGKQPLPRLMGARHGHLPEKETGRRVGPRPFLPQGRAVWGGFAAAQTGDSHGAMYIPAVKKMEAQFWPQRRFLSQRVQELCLAFEVLWEK